jgi:membrane protein YdbS with pleckstrin-like domain
LKGTSADERVMMGETVGLEARFDARLPVYQTLASTWWVLLLGVGALTSKGGAQILAIALLAMVGFYVYWFLRYKKLRCVLTERGLSTQHGLWVRVQQNIPLDQITDITVNEGPILKLFGMLILKVETAGGNVQRGAAGSVKLVAVVDALEFRDTVLKHRDIVTRHSGPTGRSTEPYLDPEVLGEIRDMMLRIESTM